jgi:hypothetical protein
VFSRGKFPKIERQPVRLLRAGLAATSFNRFEDRRCRGGTIGRSLYWRAGSERQSFSSAIECAPGRQRHGRSHRWKTHGWLLPILYNAETEDLFFNTENIQIGEAIGYRWQRDDQTAGFDAIVFHYERDMADRVELTGTNYGGDLDLLVLDDIPGVSPRGLPVQRRKKRELGGRIYAEWREATIIAQYTSQTIAGLDRQGWEVEAGYRFPLTLGPVESIQPAVRASGINNDFGPVAGFPAPSIWWNWEKYDLGLRVGLKRSIDVTVEYAQHEVDSRFPLHLREALVTVRWRG